MTIPKIPGRQPVRIARCEAYDLVRKATAWCNE